MSQLALWMRLPPFLRCGYASTLAAIVCTVLLPASGQSAITATGNVVPAYPGGGVDPWNVGAELKVGFSTDGSLTANGGSDVTSTGGTMGFDPGTVGTIVLTGAGSTWINSQDVVVGVFGTGHLNVLQGGRVENATASLGHVDGSADVLVENAGSEWINAGELFVGNGGHATLTVRDQGHVSSGATWIGLNTGATGAVLVDGPGSVWAIGASLSLGDVADSGDAMLSMTGNGSRVYVGAAAAQDSGQFPTAETALLVSATGGTAQLAIYNGNTLTNSGNGYIGVGSNEMGEVTISGAASAWHNDGNVFVGVGGTATLTLVSGGTVSAGGLLTVGPSGTIKGNGTIASNVSNTGTVSAGLSAGNLLVMGNYAQALGGKLVVELFGNAPGQFDTLQITGAAALNGELHVALGTTGGNPFAPQMGDTFTFLSSAQSLTGQFTIADLPALAAGRMWQLRYAAHSATLAVTRAGDYNDDGVVNSADYIVWRRLVGGNYDPRADGDTNGVINLADYAVWRANFGAVAGAGLGGAALHEMSAVPEPHTMGFVLSAVFVIEVFAPRRPGRVRNSRRVSRIWRRAE